MNREDITEQRLAETYSFHHSIKPGCKITATEATVLEHLPMELEIGKWSKALVYAPAIRQHVLTKPEHGSLFKLIKRGLIRVERDRRTDVEYLVKVDNQPMSVEG